MISVNPNSKKSNTQNARYNIPESAFTHYVSVNDKLTDVDMVEDYVHIYGDLLPVIEQVLNSFKDEAPELSNYLFIKFTDKEEDSLKMVIYDGDGWEEKFLIGLKDLGTRSQLEIVYAYCVKAIANYSEHLNLTEETRELSFNSSIEELIEKEVNRRVKERLDKLITFIEEIR